MRRIIWWLIEGASDVLPACMLFALLLATSHYFAIS